MPFWEGGRWFYSKNSGLQKQNVWYTRATLNGAEQVVLDPNQLSPDGSIALSGFAPSPGGKWLAYGQSEGGSDWVTYYVRDLTTGRNIADTVRWVKFSGAPWTNDGRGFFYSRYPEPPKGEQLKVKLENQTIYYHRVGTKQAQDAKIYARPDHPMWFVGGNVDESGQFLFVYTSEGTDKNEVYFAELGDPMQPKEVVGPDTVSVLGTLGLPPDAPEPQRRVALAKWVASITCWPASPRTPPTPTPNQPSHSSETPQAGHAGVRLTRHDCDGNYTISPKVPALEQFGRILRRPRGC